MEMDSNCNLQPAQFKAEYKTENFNGINGTGKTHSF